MNFWENTTLFNFLQLYHVLVLKNHLKIDMIIFMLKDEGKYGQQKAKC